MPLTDLFRRARRLRGWTREVALAIALLAVGATLMPLLIFLAGSSLLGRYEGASAARLYATVYGGLVNGSIASWIVLLGPYGAYLLLRALAAWWRLGSS